MKPLRISWRILLVILHLLVALFLSLLLLFNRFHRYSLAGNIAVWWNRRLCRLFGVRIKVDGSLPEEPVLIVANHISWFDIPALGSLSFVHFLSKAEVGTWPLIGWLAHKSGTLFIQRGARGAANKALEEVRDYLLQEENVVIFPEGTTSDGENVKRFHSRLLQAAIDSGVAIQPVVISYPHNGRIHPKLPYIDDVSLLDSILGMLEEKSMQGVIQFLPPIATDTMDRDSLAKLAENQIRERVLALQQIN